MVTYNVDNLAKKENEFVSLSYESYIEKTLADYKDINVSNHTISTENKKFEDSIRIIKNEYASKSFEGSDSDQKQKFLLTIKNWFIKIWSLICSIFDKLTNIVINLIKSLIIYIQKKKAQTNSIFQLLEKKGLRAYNDENNSIIEESINKGYTLTSLIPVIPSNTPYKWISLMLRNNELNHFVNNSILIKNRNSIFNMSALETYLKTDLINNNESEEQKIEALEESIDKLYADGVLSCEVDPKHRNRNEIGEKYAKLLTERNISGLAHAIVTGTDKPEYNQITLSDFFGLGNIPGGGGDLNELKQAFQLYYEDSKLVLGQNGLIVTIEEVLKKYKEVAKEDAIHVKNMQKFINDMLTKIDGTDGTDEINKINHRFSRFTNLIIKVKSIKSHFVRLRQSVILDIIRLYSVENRAWFLATGKGELTDNDENEIKKDDTKEIDTVITTEPYMTLG